MCFGKCMTDRFGCICGLARLQQAQARTIFCYVQCVTRCCEKFMKHSSRVGVRFAELSQAAEQQVANAMSTASR